MEVISAIFGLLGLIMIVIILNYLLVTSIEKAMIKSSYNRLVKLNKITVDFEDFESFVHQIYYLYCLNFEKMHVIYLDNKIGLIKLKKKYFKFDRDKLTLNFIFCEHCLINFHIDNTINNSLKGESNEKGNI